MCFKKIMRLKNKTMRYFLAAVAAAMAFSRPFLRVKMRSRFWRLCLYSVPAFSFSASDAVCLSTVLQTKPSLRNGKLMVGVNSESQECSEWWQPQLVGILRGSPASSEVSPPLNSHWSVAIMPCKPSAVSQMAGWMLL